MFRKKKKSSYSYTPTTEKKKWTKKKKLGCGCLSIILFFFLLGACSAMLGINTNEKPATPDQSTEEAKEEDKTTPEPKETETATIDNSNLGIGQTADFSNYTVTLNSVTVNNENIVAKITINSKEETEFKTNEFKAVDFNGRENSTITFLDDATIQPNTPYTTDLQFIDNGIVGFKWDGSFLSNAEWKIDPNAISDSVVREHFETVPITAWEAVTLKGRSEYQSFTAHFMTADNLKEEIGKDYTISLEGPCTYNDGTGEKEGTVTATVQGVGIDASYYKVQSFSIN